jgi:hypothetical protein
MVTKPRHRASKKRTAAATKPETIVVRATPTLSLWWMRDLDDAPPAFAAEPVEQEGVSP